MPLKFILTIGLLSILCTPVGVLAQDEGIAIEIPKTSKKPFDILAIQKDLRKPQVDIKRPTSMDKLKTDKLFRDLKKYSEISVKSGGVDTGGGTIVKSRLGTGLLDLYLYNKAAFSDRRTNNNILESRSLNNLGVDLITNSKQPIFQKTLAQIDKWSFSSPVLTRYLSLALKNLRFYYHQGTFATSPLEYYLPEQSNINKSDLKMIAIYIKGFGVHVGADDFKRLPETHQIALLIHESLRAMSISGGFSYSNETIQKLTAALLSDPAPGDSLDRDDFLVGGVLFSLQEYAALVQEVQILKREACSGRYTIKYTACEIQEKDATPEGARLIAEEILSELLLLPKNEKTSKPLSRAYMAVTRFENTSFSNLLTEAHLITLPYGYLTMLLDSYIDIENDKGLRNQDAVDVKRALISYFQFIGVDIRYKN